MIAWPIVLVMVVLALVAGIGATWSVLAEHGTAPDTGAARWADRIGRSALVALCVLAALQIPR